MTTRLYRSQKESVISGVCGGLGEYLNIDPLLVRLFFVLLTLANGIGLLIYVGLWIAVPREDFGELSTAETIRQGTDEIADKARSLGNSLPGNFRAGNSRAGLFIGGILILIGTAILLNNLNIVWLHWIRFDLLWPVLLIVGGGALIWRRTKGD